MRATKKICFHLLLTLILSISFLCNGNAQSAQQQSDAAHHKIAYSAVPLSFEPNLGQVNARVHYLSRGSGFSLFLTPDEAVLTLEQQKDSATLEPEPSSVDTLRMKLVGANPKAPIIGVDPQPGKVSYLVGNDPKKWHSGVPTFGKVNYSQIYKGVDLVFYGNQRQLEYDFVVEPGADPNQIAWKIDGASQTVDRDGNLQLTANNGPASFKKPFIYQNGDGRKIAVDGSFAVSSNEVRFHIGDYDHTKTLFIDPVLSYATYLGGSRADYIGSWVGPGHTSPSQGIAVDAQGSVYVTGYTYSTDFPTQNPYESTPPTKMTGVSPGQWASAYVTKFSPDGSSLVYSTYIGGNGFDYGFAIAVDSNDNAYIAGSTTSPDFPATQGAYQTVCSPAPTNQPPPYASNCTSFYQPSAFVTKLNSTGTGLVYSTFLGGWGNSGAVAIAVDNAGRAYIAGNVEEYCYVYTTFQGCFPTTAGAAVSGNVTGGGSPNYGFVAVFDPTGAQLLYSSMFGDPSGAGGVGETDGIGVAVDPNGYFTLAGHTRAAVLPTTAGVIQPTQGPSYNSQYLYAWRGFVAKFNPVTSPGGATLAYATYLGAPALDPTSNVSDFVSGVATDNDGEVYVTGYTQSPNYPVTTGAYQTTCGYGGGQSCAATYITKLNPTLSAIEWATYLGNTTGSGNDNIAISGPMQIDGNGNVYVTGQAWFGFPQVNAVEPGTIGGNVPAFVAELDPKGQKLLFSTQINSDVNSIGVSEELPAGVAIDTAGNIYVAGNVNGPNLIVTPGAFQTTENDFNGQCCTDGNGFVVKIAPQSTATVDLVATPSPAQAGQTVTLKATITPTSLYASGPTGTVDFQDGAADLGWINLSGGVASLPISTLPAGDHTIVAFYSGDATYSPVNVSASLTITPTDTAPAISPNPAVFGNQALNTPAQIPVTITNTGSNPLVISSVTPVISSDFSLTNNCITTLAVNASCQITIAFNPTVASPESATFTIGDNAGVQILQATGTGVNPVESQTITFNALPSATYGVGSSMLTATASSTLPVSYAVNGPATISGAMLTISGAGTVTVTASQAGNASYSAALPVSQSFTVNKAGLTVTANDMSRQYKAANPAFTYSVAGFVNGDTTSVISGSATETTTATSTSDAGSYPITFSSENLTAANYTFSYVNGTLTVSGGVSQTITFNPLPSVTYGVNPITLAATTSSSLPVSFALVSGPASVSGSSVTITGSGVVTVMASQPGNTDYAAAAPVSQSFTVIKAPLTVTANNASRQYGAANPSLTYTIMGFVNGDTSSVVSGSATETTTATATSAPGTYPISFSAQALTAGNYTFGYVNGSLTVLMASQTITFNPLANVTLGVAPITLTATASSGLPVSYSVTGPATVSASTLTITGIGLVTVTASQTGNLDYAAATAVSQSFTVVAAATGNFTITAIPPVEIDRGIIGVFVLQISPLNGFKGNVTLACSGLPSGTRCIDFPQTVKVNGTAWAVSEIVFPAKTKPGTYTVTFTGVSGSLVNTATAKIKVK